ncbi:DUF1573 domain-containing protein [bacterium]|nr:DUF1573 domain-containing protein [bacterium]
MKNWFILILAALAFSACNNGESNDETIAADAIEIKEGQDNPEPRFEWSETEWDFGTIVDGERVEHTFRFKNVGDDALIISNATASCGCTIPVWPKKPIPPGETGEIKVEFNSSGKNGYTTKDVTILANTTPVKTILKIKAEVVKNKS